MLKDPHTSGSVLSRIVSLLPSDSLHWQTLAINPSLPNDAVTEKIDDLRIAGSLARNPYLSSACLATLAQSPDQNVRTAAARNLSTPRESLEKLAHDKDGTVRRFAQENLAGTLGDFACRKQQ
jgi:hypothetical protein